MDRQGRGQGAGAPAGGVLGRLSPVPALSPMTSAPFATDPARSRGRIHPEPGDISRTLFQRDRDRVVHCNAFRRLKDKTQVFVYDEGDHYRTRLTHTLEVSQVARSVARSLGLEEDLAEAMALAHDLGHPPFGHAGERALAAEMADFGGFDHNAQSLRVVTELERRYPGFNGLNLTWETLEGLAKHNGPLVDATGRPTGPYAAGELPYAVVAYDQIHDLELASHAGPEAQVAAISDDIAYNAHDIDDGLRAGLVNLVDLREVDFLDEIIRDILRQYPDLADERVRAELIRRLISAMIDDVVDETAARLGELAPASVADIRAAPGPWSLLAPGWRPMKPRSRRHSPLASTAIGASSPSCRRPNGLFGDCSATSSPIPLSCRWIGGRTIASTRRQRRGGSPISSPA